MTRIELTHVVAADAPSVALVLAGPAARDLWPCDSDATPAYDITVDPPSRAGVGFSARMTVTAGADKVGSGRLTIVPIAGAQGRCEVRLALTAADGAGRTLHHIASEYVQNVGEVSQARSTPA